MNHDFLPFRFLFVTISFPFRRSYRDVSQRWLSRLTGFILDGMAVFSKESGLMVCLVKIGYTFYLISVSVAAASGRFKFRAGNSNGGRHSALSAAVRKHRGKLCINVLSVS